MQKLIRKHQWITKPNIKGISYYGLTNYAKDYFLRFDSLCYQDYFKTKYGIMYNNRISQFLQNTKSNYKYKTNTQLFHNINKISMAQRIQYDRFCIKQGQSFLLLKTVQFDVQLKAPIDMRILQVNFDASYYCKIYQVDYLLKVEVLNQNGFEKMISQKQYENGVKIIQYDGMLL